MNELTLVIPAKEEAESLPLVLDEIKDLNLKVIVVLADDDLKTINALKNYNCEILYQSQRGYGNAIIEGIKKAQTKYIAIFYILFEIGIKFHNHNFLMHRLFLNHHQLVQ